MGIGTAGLATRPDEVAPYHKLGHLDEWFDTTAFTPAPYGFFGNATNGMIRGPGYTSANFSFDKTFPQHGTAKVQFRAEIT